MRRCTILVVAAAAISAGVALFTVRRFASGPGQTAKDAGVTLATVRPRRTPPPPTAADLALIAPLKPGEVLAGWTLTEIQGVESGVLGVVMSREQGSVRLIVALASDEAPVPPASAGRFAVYYSARRTLPDDARSLAGALADILQKNQSVPTPPGLSPFNPPPKPGISL
jgi:hypothetical protein